MASVMDVIKGLSQAASNAYDGALDENGNYLDVGLRREEGNPLIDERVIDGFNIKFHGNKLILCYHTAVKLKEVHNSGFESEIESQITQIAKFLKTEYRKVTGDNVSLTAEGEVDILVQSSGYHRSWIQAYMTYNIGGIEEVQTVGQASEDSMEASYRSFLDQGGFKGKEDKSRKANVKAKDNKDK
jgi:hypothetical protein